MKKRILAILAVFVVWSVLDYIIHGLILAPSYAATAHLWRPMEEMKQGLMHVTTLITAVTFVSIYSLFFREKGIGQGLKYGAWFGVGMGVSMGYGTYSVMDIPYHMALTWFLGTVVQSIAAGLVTGAIDCDTKS